MATLLPWNIRPGEGGNLTERNAWRPPYDVVINQEQTISIWQHAEHPLELLRFLAGRKAPSIRRSGLVSLQSGLHRLVGTHCFPEGV